jgi:hypothetical protein
MTAEMLANLIPMIAMLTVFGMPVAIVFTVMHFRFRHRELEAELEMRRMIAQQQGTQLQARVERLESVLLSQQPAQAAALPAPLPADASLYEPPPLAAAEPQAAGKREAER